MEVMVPHDHFYLDEYHTYCLEENVKNWVKQNSTGKVQSLMRSREGYMQFFLIFDNDNDAVMFQLALPLI